MDIQEAVNLSVQLTGEKPHKDYKYTVEMRDKILAFYTGKGLAPYMSKYFPDADEREINKICNVTQPITVSCINRLIRPIKKATNSEITRRVETDSKELIEYIGKYYGGKSLSYYLDNIWTTTYITDPNAFEISDWGEFDNINDKAKPYPVIIACDHIHDFSMVNEELKWVMVHTPDSEDWTFYTKGLAIKLKETKDDSTINIKGIEIPEGFKLEIEVIDTGLDEINLIRVGNITDPYTSHKTCISIIEPAMPRLEKLLKTGAEVDFAFNLHAMTKKAEIVQSCTGFADEGCDDNGCAIDGSKCKLCHGTKKTSQTSSKDVKEIPMPRNKEDIPDLSKLYHYEEVPRGIIDLEVEYQDSLEEKCFKDVYNSNLLQENTGEKTATEVTTDYEGIKDTLQPFEDRYSEGSKWHVHTIAAIRSETVKSVLCQFPYNLELEPTRQLILNRNNINGPSYVLEDYDIRIAERLYRDNPDQIKKFKVQQACQPFSGKDLNTIKYIRSQGYIKPIDLALYDNYEMIWESIDYKPTDSTEKIKAALYKAAEEYLPKENTIKDIGGLEGNSEA